MRATLKLGVVTALAFTAVVAMGGSAFAAGGGYGPSTAASGGVPGGFATVASSKVIGPSGGALSASVPGGTVTVTVPAGAFTTSEQVVITVPVLGQTDAALSSLGFSGYQAVAGAGVSVLDGSGSPVSGTFAAPLTVTLAGTSLGVTGERVIQLTGPASASVVTSRLGVGSVSVAVSSDPDLVAVNPTTPVAYPAASGQAQVSGATDQHTGLPFTGEEDVAGVLAVLGAAALVAAGVRRLRARTAR